jgi:hypothetical protein
MHLIGAVDQSLDLSAIKPFNTAAASTRWVKLQAAARLFHDVLGLVIVELFRHPNIVQGSNRKGRQGAMLWAATSLAHMAGQL